MWFWLKLSLPLDLSYPRWWYRQIYCPKELASSRFTLIEPDCAAKSVTHSIFKGPGNTINTDSLQIIAREQLGLFSLVFLDTGDRFSLKTYLQIFTGFKPEKSDRNVSAISDGGAYAYLGILHGLTDCPNSSGKIHVVPGNIEHQGTPFHYIRDDRHFQQFIEDVLDSVSFYSQVNVGVTETTTDLEVCFKVSKNPESPVNVLRTRPSEFVQRLGQLRGILHCAGSRCKFVMDVPSDTNYVRFNALGEDVRVLKGEALVRCLALFLSYNLPLGCLLRGKECIQCCLRAAVQHASSPLYSNFETAHISPTGGFPFLIVSGLDN